jgi:hypothetical protein
MRLQHDREKDEGYQEKRTKVVRLKVDLLFYFGIELLVALDYNCV